MSTLITRDEDIKSSALYVGYLILHELQKKQDGKISIFEIVEKLKKRVKVLHYRQVFFALMFLHINGVVNFSEPYIYTVKS